MKVLNSIKIRYDAQLDQYKHLDKKVTDIFLKNKKRQWHYTNRIKELESFALKIESGRFDEKDVWNDLFACTLVVENSTEISKGVDLVKQYCDVCYSMSCGTITKKFPSDFGYDELRLYVKLRQPQGSPPDPIHDILFEIQIKTFLQHAWSIATHDLVYKSNEISWAKERVSFQIKAMLEHVEVSIDQLGNIQKSTIIDKKHRKTMRLNEIKSILQKKWEDDRLPKDLTRISRNIDDLCQKLEIKHGDLGKILDEEDKKNLGSKTLNLSPYFTIVQSIINQKPEKLVSFFEDTKQKDKIVISSEINLKNIKSNENKVIDVNKILQDTVKNP